MAQKRIDTGRRDDFGSSGSDIGAGSVVSQDIPDNIVATGNPVRVLGSLESFLNKHKEQMRRFPCFGEEYTLART